MTTFSELATTDLDFTDLVEPPLPDFVNLEPDFLGGSCLPTFRNFTPLYSDRKSGVLTFPGGWYSSSEASWEISEKIDYERIVKRKPEIFTYQI